MMSISGTRKPEQLLRAMLQCPGNRPSHLPCVSSLPKYVFSSTHQTSPSPCLNSQLKPLTSFPGSPLALTVPCGAFTPSSAHIQGSEWASMAPSCSGIACGQYGGWLPKEDESETLSPGYLSAGPWIPFQWVTGACT